MKYLLACAIAFCLPGCASSTTPADPEYVAVARLALHDTERTPGTYVIVAGPDINDKAKAALGTLGRKVVTLDSIPHTDVPTRNSDYLWLSKFDVATDEARFDTMVGVETSPQQVASAVSCGVGSQILMARKSGAWEVVTNRISVCTKH